LGSNFSTASFTPRAHGLSGKIRALWIIGTNSVHSWINQADVQEILGRLELLVVQDMYATTQTARLAHVFLPAAGWGEKEGTFINSERRIGLFLRTRGLPEIPRASLRGRRATSSATATTTRPRLQRRREGLVCHPAAA
jgi:assimilatory nitrate reductase catalytic subunit